MIAPHPRLKVNIAEQFARPIVAAAHPSPPNLFGAKVNHAQNLAASTFFNSLLEAFQPLTPFRKCPSKRMQIKTANK